MIKGVGGGYRLSQSRWHDRLWSHDRRDTRRCARARDSRCSRRLRRHMEGQRRQQRRVQVHGRRRHRRQRASSTSPGVPATIDCAPMAAFVAGGTANAPIPASGAGTRMMWHGGKAAFRAGVVDSTQWDEVNVGTGSAAFGAGTRASARRPLRRAAHARAGAGSAAFGQDSVAQADTAFAAGDAARAEGVLLARGRPRGRRIGRQCGPRLPGHPPPAPGPSRRETIPGHSARRRWPWALARPP